MSISIAVYEQNLSVFDSGNPRVKSFLHLRLLVAEESLQHSCPNNS